MGNVITIGIAGGTGSGKTTITEKIVRRFGGNVTVVYYDNYYKAHDDLTYEQRAKLNYDHPDAFDTDLILRDLAALRRGEAAQCPVYDYTVHNRAKETKELNPAPVIIVEGILILHDTRMCDMMDIKIFGDAVADERDVRDRGRSLESVIEQYLTTVKPMHEKFVEPSKRNADIVVPRGGSNTVALSMIMESINTHILR